MRNQPASFDGSDRQCLLEHFLVIRVAWTKHYAMIAKADRPGHPTVGCSSVIITDGAIAFTRTL